MKYEMPVGIRTLSKSLSDNSGLIKEYFTNKNYVDKYGLEWDDKKMKLVDKASGMSVPLGMEEKKYDEFINKMKQSRRIASQLIK